IGAVLLAVLVLGVGGVRSGDHEPASEPATTVAARPTPGTQAPPVARVQGGRTIPVVVMHAGDADRFLPYQPVSGLVPDAVVRVRVDGFDWHERGSVRQCVVELGHQTACGEPFPVQFDGDGRADFQFAVRGDIAAGACRIGQPTCLLRVAGESGDRQVSVQTVLVDVLTPGEVRIEPAVPLADGQTVDVIVSGFPPGATATAVLCAPPEIYDARLCGLPDPTSTFAIDPAGTGRTTLTVSAGRLGSEAALCGPRRVCGVAVVVGGGFVAAPVTPVQFSLGPGVAYDGGRVLLGVLVALALIGAALVIARRTDWTKPTEAATPDLDSSDLRTGQSLDDLFGTEEQLDERDPILW
ncbi:MAG: hypothetical protein Q8K72_20080, partial [Acidimicrobiales bacterium]|nr:hypothetical protein [Acidimicrobiales bacterium]